MWLLHTAKKCKQCVARAKECICAHTLNSYRCDFEAVSKVSITDCDKHVIIQLLGDLGIKISIPWYILHAYVLCMTVFNCMQVGVRDYVCALEKAVTAVCKCFGVSSTTAEETGVWVNDCKICAIGMCDHGTSATLSCLSLHWQAAFGPYANFNVDGLPEMVWCRLCSCRDMVMGNVVCDAWV